MALDRCHCQPTAAAQFVLEATIDFALATPGPISVVDMFKFTDSSLSQSPWMVADLAQVAARTPCATGLNFYQMRNGQGKVAYVPLMTGAVISRQISTQKFYLKRLKVAPIRRIGTVIRFTPGKTDNGTFFPGPPHTVALHPFGPSLVQLPGKRHIGGCIGECVVPASCVSALCASPWMCVRLFACRRPPSVQPC